MDKEKLAQSFKEDIEKARKERTMIWGKPLDGIEFYLLPIVRPGLDFKLVKVSNGNELVYKFGMNQTDYYFIWEEITKVARLMNYYF